MAATLQQVAALVIFLLVVIAVLLLVLAPLRVRLPAALAQRLHLQHVTISYAWAPVAGVLAMLATGAISPAQVAAGVVGDERMAPYGIVLLFLCLAYLSASLDATGCFAWLALHLTHLCRGSGLALYLGFNSLASLMTVVTSNDIVVMTLTPITCYFAAASMTDPLPFLAAQFTAANTWSMLLFVGNPTNVIVALAFRMSFLGYSKWMALPTLAAGLACLAAVLLAHRARIPRRLALPALDPSLMLRDVPGAALGSANILACLGLLAAAPVLGWQLHYITLVCAGLQASYNLVAYVLARHRWCRRLVLAEAAAAEAAAGGLESGRSTAAAEADVARASGNGCVKDAAALPPECDVQLACALPHRHRPARVGAAAVDSCVGSSSVGSGTAAGAGAGAAAADLQVTVHQSQQQQYQHCSSSLQALPCIKQAGLGASSSSSSSNGGDGEASGSSAPTPAALLAALQPPLPRFWALLLGLPWDVVPFVLGMFVLVAGLEVGGWIDKLARVLGASLHGSVWLALLGVGGVSALLANVMNNQPATILMSRAIMSNAFAAGIAAGGGGGAGDVELLVLAAALGVVVASNVAACFTVNGALAGIMWRNILARRGHHVGYVQFTQLMGPAGLAAFGAALLVLGGQLAAWGLG